MHIRAFARRNRDPEQRSDEPTLEALRAESPVLSPESGLPASWLRGIRSFYDDLHAEPGVPRACGGTACRFAGVRADSHPVYCLGRCYEAPAHENRPAAPIPRMSLAARPVVLRHLLAEAGAAGASDPFADYALPDGDAILAAVEASGLRGRGGAAYPTGAKWATARATPAPERFVVANGDEGDPGAFVDRLLLEEAPHCVLAGMLACARAIGAGRGIVYVRSEYPRAVDRVNRAITEAKAAGKLEGFHVEVLRGAGSVRGRRRDGTVAVDRGSARGAAG
jgi:hypothetical protein